MDASNLAWKIGLVAQNKAKLESLMSTYGPERREHACRIIETSGEYLRFVCATNLQVADVRSLGKDSSTTQNGTETSVRTNDVTNGTTNGTTNGITKGAMNGTVNKTEIQKQNDLKFLASFFGRNGQFLLGVDAPFGPSVLTPPQFSTDNGQYRRPLKVNHGVRAPNPRVCFSAEETGYLYDKMTGAATFHIVIFASSLPAAIRRKVSTFAAALSRADSFYQHFGGSDRFNILVVVKRLPWETDAVMSTPELQVLKQHATIIYDDRAPDEDAHTTWGANHADGGLAVVRPDLWVGMTAFPDDVDAVSQYFDGFLLPVSGPKI